MRRAFDEIDALKRRIADLERRTTVGGGGVPAGAHASSHSEGGADEVDVTDLGGYPGGSPLLYLDSSGAFTDPGTSGGGITQLTGDVTAGPGSGSQVATLANTAVTPGVYGAATDIPVITVDAKGRITAASDVAVTFPTLVEPHGITVDGGGSVLTTGVKGRWRCPFDFEIVRWTLLADQTGDIEFDVKVSAFGGAPASIVGGAPPELVNAIEDDDTGLTGWTPGGSAGDEFEFEITGTPDDITRVTLVLDLERV